MKSNNNWNMRKEQLHYLKVSTKGTPNNYNPKGFERIKESTKGPNNYNPKGFERIPSINIKIFVNEKTKKFC